MLQTELSPSKEKQKGYVINLVNFLFECLKSECEWIAPKAEKGTITALC